MNSMLGWTVYLRKFIVTGREDFWKKALDVCQDNCISDFLRQLDSSTKPGMIPEVHMSDVERLRMMGREADSALIELLVMKHAAVFAETQERLGAQVVQQATTMCSHAAELSSKCGFTECEAYFLRAVSLYEIKSESFPNALRHAERASGLFREVSKADPTTYSPLLADTLNAQGIILMLMHRPQEASKVSAESVEVMNGLVELESSTYRPLLADLLVNQGSILFEQNNLVKAREVYTKALSILRELEQIRPGDYVTSVAQTTNQLGLIAMRQDNLSVAREAFEETVRIYGDLVRHNKTQHLLVLTVALRNLGVVLLRSNDFPKAQTTFEQGLQTYHRLGPASHREYLPILADILTCMAKVQLNENEPDKAVERLKDVLRVYCILAQEHPSIYVPRIAETLDVLEASLRKLNSLDEAQEAYEGALSVFMSVARTKAGYTQWQLGVVLSELGLALCATHALSKAGQLYHQALAILRQCTEVEQETHMSLVADALTNLAGVLLGQHAYHDARDAAEEALAISKRLAEANPNGHQKRVATTLNNLAAVLQKQHEFGDALHLCDEALIIWRELARLNRDAYQHEVASALEHSGALLVNMREFTRSLEAFYEALAMYQELADSHPETYLLNVAETLSRIAGVYHSQKEYTEAIQKYEEAICILRRSGSDRSSSLLAEFLNRQGETLQEAGEVPKARDAIEEALAIRRELAKTQPKPHIADVAESLVSLGKLLVQEGNPTKAHKVYEEAISILRESRQELPHLCEPLLAHTLGLNADILQASGEYTEAAECSTESVEIYGELAKTQPVHGQLLPFALRQLGNVLRKTRRLLEAQDALIECVDIFRGLAKIDKSLFAPELANSLSDLANILADRSDYLAAKEMYERSLQIRRRLAESKPEAYLEDLARTLNNLATLRVCDPSERRQWAQESVGAYRRLVREGSERLRPNLATALQGLAEALEDEGELSQAREACTEALTIHCEIGKTEPGVYEGQIPATRSILGRILEKLGENGPATRQAERVVRTIERSRTQHRYLEGRWAYSRLLRSAAETGDSLRVFQYLVALTGGRVQTSTDSTSHYLEQAVHAVKSVEECLDRKICIVVATQLTSHTSIMGVLRSRGPNMFKYQICRSLAHKMHHLTEAVWKGLGSDAPQETQKIVEGSGRSAWHQLPSFVRAVLHPDKGYDILICGDALWTQFPWEGLRWGKRCSDWLGLHSHLARLKSIECQYLNTLRPTPFGEGQLTAAVICPWNVPGSVPLKGALQESEAVADFLRAKKYALVPRGMAETGESATGSIMATILKRTPSIIHFAGHAGTAAALYAGRRVPYHGVEEVLCLWDHHAHGLQAFSWEELAKLGSQQRCPSRPLLQKSLVILNACFAGQMREYGLDREDLVSHFLRHGAEAVIASPTPVPDLTGTLTGVGLYEFAGACSGETGQALLRVRQKTENYCRQARYELWPAWIILYYHGNPYARFPHISTDH